VGEKKKKKKKKEEGNENYISLSPLSVPQIHYNQQCTLYNPVYGAHKR
jgi:hypothetical protein